ncbi:polymorphic toxin type 15 domain-containing protein [Leptospira wolffii]|uniref:polymorphic toxin type 15 domain-containing protein n=1 Tax=Leptospira wolffii TaxID=409998 RepID=UPI0014383016|nr:polymorphic toxin type 15 domain-containing protein [Leptospira wolffii]
MDLIDGKASSWQDYVAAGVGGAAGGVAATTCGPMCVGAVSGAAQDLTKQALTKGIKDIDLNQTANSAATGAILGKAGQLGGKVVVAAGSKITSKIPQGVKNKVAESASKFAQGTGKVVPNVVKTAVKDFGNSAKKNLGFGKPTPKPVDLKLKFKAEWSQEQRQAAIAKCDALTKADTVVSKSQRGSTSAADMWRKAGNETVKGKNVDHIVDLQLGGPDAVQNMQLLDESVNKSLGSQIMHRIKNLTEGTPIGKVTIE